MKLLKKKPVKTKSVIAGANIDDYKLMFTLFSLVPGVKHIKTDQPDVYFEIPPEHMKKMTIFTFLLLLPGFYFIQYPQAGGYYLYVIGVLVVGMLGQFLFVKYLKNKKQLLIVK